MPLSDVRCGQTGFDLAICICANCRPDLVNLMKSCCKASPKANFPPAPTTPTATDDGAHGEGL